MSGGLLLSSGGGGLSSLKTSAENFSTTVNGSRQTPRLSPALTHVWSRNVSRSQPYSVATCGKSSPAKRPRLTIRPSRPTMTSSKAVTRSIGPMTEISMNTFASSSRRTGRKRGSRNAALSALEWTARQSASRAWIEPMQPRRSPACVRRVTNAPAGRRSVSWNVPSSGTS